MAKMMKKLVALLMALTLTVGMTIPAAATETTIDTTAGVVEGTETTTQQTVPNPDGTSTEEITTVVETPAGGAEVPSAEPNTTVNVEYKETETTSTTTNDEGEILKETGSTEGEETVTTTTTTEGTPVTEEVYAGTVEVTFDEKGEIIEAESTTTLTPDLPEAPEGAENVQTEEDKITWEETVDGQPIAGEGDGTDVDADGIIDNITTETVTTTTTTVESKDRELGASLSDIETTENNEIVTGEVEAIGDAELPEDETWTELSEEDQAKVENIQDQLYFGTEDAAKAAATQLALDVLLNGSEIPADTDETIKAAAQALIDAAAQQTAEPTETPAPATPEITVTNVALTVNEKVDDEEENEDDNADNDIYDASVKFDVYVTTDVSGQLTVVVKQGEQTIEEKTLTDADKNVDGSYNVNIQNMKLQEGVDIDLDIQLDGVQELETNQMYVYSTTVEEPVEVEDQTLTGGSSHTGNDKGGNGAMQAEHGKPIVDTNSWSVGNYDNDFSVGEAKVNVKTAGKTEDDREIVTIKSDKTIEADYIVIKAASGYIKYPVPGGILVAGVTYTVENEINSKLDGKIHDISHVSIYGSGKETEAPTSTKKTTSTILGVAEESLDVNLGVNMTLDFAVKEATLTTTANQEEVTTVTRTWEDSYENYYEPENDKPTPTPNPNPEPNPEPTPDPEPGIDPQNDDFPIEEPVEEPIEINVEDDLEDENVIAALIDILDVDVPLADAPNTGDITLLLAAMSLVSLGGAALMKKKED